MTARRIGTYELLELLGEGGIGQVYAARDTVLGRQVAIKMLRTELSRDRNFISRFYNEAQSLGDLSHANITTLHTLHLEGREPFMVMELVHGRTLEALLERVHRIPLRESLAAAAQTVAGLAYAHRRGVIHRDIKPSNLMLTDAGLLKIMDFGIARVRGTQRLTRAGQIFGTLLYASPEQIRGNDVDERSDLYSLAVVLYEMLSGSPPFAAENEHALMTAHLESPPPPLTERVRGLDAAVEPAVMRALSKNPEERFASVEEFGRAVGAGAVRGDAADILQDYLAAVFRNAPPQTRFMRAHGGAGVNRSGSPDARAGGESSGVRPRRSRAPGLLVALKSPVAVLGAVVVALALSLGYVALWPKRPIQPGQQVAAVEPSRTLPPAPATISPASAPSPVTRGEPPLRPAPQPAVLRDAPSPTEPPPSPSALPPPPSGPPVISPRSTQPDSAPPLLSAPSLPPKAPPEPEPEVAFYKPPPQPQPHPVLPRRPKPDLQGKVSAVVSTSRIRVGDRWVELYGINDPTERAHTQEMIAFLRPSGGFVECYQKTSGKYQCYADGKDLAILALGSGLAHPAPDAPTEYRTPSVMPSSARH